MDGFDFVEIIEAELKRRNITKAEFYAATEISSATFSQWRKRIYSPSSSAVKKVEQFLGIKFTFGQENKPATHEGRELTEMQQKAVDMILNMSDAQLKAFIAAAEAFLT